MRGTPERIFFQVFFCGLHRAFSKECESRICNAAGKIKKRHSEISLLVKLILDEMRMKKHSIKAV